MKPYNAGEYYMDRLWPESASEYYVSGTKCHNIPVIVHTISGAWQASRVIITFTQHAISIWPTSKSQTSAVIDMHTGRTRVISNWLFFKSVFDLALMWTIMGHVQGNFWSLLSLP